MNKVGVWVALSFCVWLIAFGNAVLNYFPFQSESTFPYRGLTLATVRDADVDHTDEKW